MTAQSMQVSGTKRLRDQRIHASARNYFFPAIAFFLTMGFWEILVKVTGIKPYILPAPSVILNVLLQKYTIIATYSLVTGWEVILGFLLSVAVGIPLSVGIYYSKILERIFYPFLVSAQTVPKIAIAPLLVIWFGWGLLPKVIVAFTIAFFPIVIDTVVGLKSTQPEMIYLVRSMGANRFQSFSKISLPAALPSIFGGLKVAVTLAVVGAVVGEFVASDAGLGYLLLVANGYLDTPLMFSGIAALSILGVLFFFVIEGLERIVIPWRREEQQHVAEATM